MSRSKVFNIKNSTIFAVVVAFIVFLMVGGCGGDDDGGNPTGGDGGGDFKPGDQFNPNISYGSFTDPRDGQTYRTVIIGGKRWMAENLNYETSDSSWCYENKPDNCKKYGRLYTWSRAISACEAIGSGWRLPDTADWNRLDDAAGGWEVAGSKLKSKTGWKTYPGISSTNEFGFSALPGGSRPFGDGSFGKAGNSGHWWSASEYRSNNGAWCRDMYHAFDYVVGYPNSNSTGHSARCVQE